MEEAGGEAEAGEGRGEAHGQELQHDAVPLQAVARLARKVYCRGRAVDEGDLRGVGGEGAGWRWRIWGRILEARERGREGESESER